jgi:hypothetical protein
MNSSTKVPIIAFRFVTSQNRQNTTENRCKKEDDHEPSKQTRKDCNIAQEKQKPSHKDERVMYWSFFSCKKKKKNCSILSSQSKTHLKTRS